eukprot:TRINITY_DN1694_c0_g1_i1.p1 TRINITY_DN1694_c0_g1~~TRINITY_DN1694_c0_g1_i1.p1  ORF type:complete len:456 (-),score=124.21 TRINITY_DN1694_c0_g1_i1:173-1339(-)
MDVVVASPSSPSQPQFASSPPPSQFPSPKTPPTPRRRNKHRNRTPSDSGCKDSNNNNTLSPQSNTILLTNTNTATSPPPSPPPSLSSSGSFDEPDYPFFPVLFLDELLLQIFSYLNDQDLLIVEKVNKKWRAIANLDEFWKNIYHCHVHQNVIPSKRENKNNLSWKTFFCLEKTFSRKIADFQTTNTEIRVRFPIHEPLHHYVALGCSSHLLELDLKLTHLLFRNVPSLVKREKKNQNQTLFHHVEDVLEKLFKELKFSTPNKQRDNLVLLFAQKVKDRILSLFIQNFPFWKANQINSSFKSILLEDKEWVKNVFLSALFFQNSNKNQQMECLQSVEKQFFELTQFGNSPCLYLAIDLSVVIRGKEVPFFGLVGITPFLLTMIHFQTN